MDNFIITIARGFGSGGKTIGEELAKKLGVKCYNKELLELASERSGINKEYFFEKDEKVSKKLGKRNTGAYQGVTSSFSDSMFFTEHNLFEYQAKTIVNLANTESCFINISSKLLISDSCGRLPALPCPPNGRCSRQPRR